MPSDMNDETLKEALSEYDSEGPAEDSEESDGSSANIPDMTVIKVTEEYRKQAEQARKDRERRNIENNNIYLGKQDWSHKLAGQSAEFLPMVPIAVEQIAAFIKRALVDYGDWFSVDMADNPALTDDQAREIILSQLNTLNRVDGACQNFPTLISDGIKVGLLNALVVFKVYGKHCTHRTFHIERAEEILETASGPISVPKYTVSQKEKTEWHLAIDLIRPDDYYPDPTGRGLFEIHRVRRDLHEVEALAEGDNPIYDKDVVSKIKSDFAETDRLIREAEQMNQEVTTPPTFRKEVVIDEVWGTILDEDGHVLKKNAVWAIANEKYLIRKPEDNPWWHGQSPFVAAPLVRVPFSVWHKALADLATPLNIAANELFSLMLDGAFESVHGIKQLRTDYVEHPEDLSGGIPPGTTIPVKQELPFGGKVLERVDEGEVPADAINMFSILERQFQASMQTNDIRMGNLPSKQVRATEIIQAEQNLTSFFDGMIRDVEDGLIAPLLWKVWMVIVQEMDDLPGKYIKNESTRRALEELAFLRPEERYVVLANSVSFAVRGLSGTLQRAKDFQKFMALLTAVSGSPMLLQTFFTKYSPDKALRMLFKWINLNPETLKMDNEEMAQLNQRMAQLPLFAQATGSGSVGRAEAGGGMESEINQTSNPLTGLAGGEG
jgi:hypothetical protein